MKLAQDFHIKSYNILFNNNNKKGTEPIDLKDLWAQQIAVFGPYDPILT